MDPPPEGCRWCGSTWGDVWEEVEGRRDFFCCGLCASEWRTLLGAIRRATRWPSVDRVELQGGRWGRGGRAYRGAEQLEFRVVFTPEGRLRTFATSSGPSPSTAGTAPTSGRA
jgi:Ta0938